MKPGRHGCDGDFDQRLGRTTSRRLSATKGFIFNNTQDFIGRCAAAAPLGDMRSKPAANATLGRGYARAAGVHGEIFSGGVAAEGAAKWWRISARFLGEDLRNAEWLEPETRKNELSLKLASFDSRNWRDGKVARLFRSSGVARRLCLAAHESAVRGFTAVRSG